MTIERKIRINNRDYFLGVELKYIKDKILIQTNGNDFDMGDLSIMIQDNDDGKITCISCINKDEIIDYIKDNKIKINRWDKSSCRCPLLYKQRREPKQIVIR